MTDFLTQCDLDDIEATVLETLDKTCVVMRPSRASDGMGGQTVTWVESGDIACRVSDAEYHFELTGDRTVTLTTVRVTLPRDTDVQMGDIIVFDGESWTVDGTPLQSYRTLVVSCSTRRP